MNTKRFSNKVAIVTGASRGIGQGIALAFAREGAHVVSVDIGDQAETGKQAKALGAKFHSYTEDFGKLTQKSAAELIAKILADTGRVDILVNNAGIIRRAPIVDHSEADWNAVLRINLSAPFFLTQAVAKWWVTGGREKS
ncbi:MAG: SDR family NAD(P)-dependent oxidoreductase, partial [Verrucomicrobiae bacterium]|nr:SDR family NAD(P)-dependent oxidoreductase [Verrucomicrobiae bacterium]